jgi:hypothetical protein
MVRQYVRDKRGRFASKGGGVLSRPKQPRPAPKGGSITRSLKRGQTALYKAEQMRAQTLMRESGGGSVAGLRLIRGAIKRGAASRTPSTAPRSGGGQQRGSVTRAMRGTMRQLAQSDARYFRGVEQLTRSSKQQGQIGGKRSSRKRLSGS